MSTLHGALHGGAAWVLVVLEAVCSLISFAAHVLRYDMSVPLPPFLSAP